jgi:hypothetical protein
MTHPHVSPQNNGPPVLVRDKETREDYNNPAESFPLKDHVTMSFDCSKQFDIVNLYSADEEQSRNTCLPFLQNIEFTGPQGEIVRVTALFDKGAMISAMCTSTFNKVKHRLGNWKPSNKRL